MENFAHRGDAHYYWLTGEFENNDAENEKNDHWALDNGYVAITRSEEHTSELQSHA